MAIKASDLMSHQAAGGDGQQQRLLTLKAPAEFAEGLRAPIDPAAIQGYAAELMRPPAVGWRPEPPAGLEEYYQPSALGLMNQAVAAASESILQALEPSARDFMNQAVEMLSGAGSFASGAQLFDPSIVWGTLLNHDFVNHDFGRGAFDGLDMAQNALRNSGFSLGLLDDVDQVLSRRNEQRLTHERRREAAEQQVQGVLLRLRPEPPAEMVQVVHLAPGDWQEALTHALTTGQASPRDVGEFLYSLSAQQRQAGPVPPAWEDIEAVAMMYRDNGHRYKNQGRFVEYLASKGMAIGLSTFKEWIKLYEQNTGVKVRPGQGSRKRKTIIG